MKKHFLLFLLVFLTFSKNSVAQDAESSNGDSKTITIAADEWCPYNCASDSDKPGFMIEIAKQVFEPKGYKIVYEVMPWERAIEETRKGTYNAIVGAGEHDAPDFIIPTEALGYTSNVFYVKPTSSWKYEGIDSLKTISIGVIDGYSYEETIDKYIAENNSNTSRIQSVSGETGLDQNFKKLEKGRIDAYLENMNVAQQYIADNNLWGKYKVAGQIIGEPKDHYLYIAFSPHKKESGEYAKILSSGVKELRQSGKLKELLNKYNVVDWQNNKSVKAEESEE